MSRIRLSALALILFIAKGALSHQGHHHHPGSTPSPSPSGNSSFLFKRINEDYLKRVKPIFQEKCMDCHSQHTRFPWYYALPIAKQWINHDISEANEHIDMTGDFPFKSHATPIEDLQAIRDSVNDGSMPPFGYRIFHSGSSLSEAEKRAVIDWANEGEQLLKTVR